MLLPTSSGRIKISFPLCSYLRSLEKIEIHLTERRPSQVRVSILKGVSFRSSLFDWNQVKQSVFSSLEQSSSPAPAGLGCLQLCLLVMILLIFFWLYRCQDCYDGKVTNIYPSLRIDFGSMLVELTASVDASIHLHVFVPLS